MKAFDLRYIMATLLVMIHGGADAQLIDPTTNYVPSPDAVALGKYGDVPIGYHTGSANISIPLYTLKGKKLSVPISLSYNSTGIRVDEVASAVGLGWSLNAGGVITRTIRGLPDEKPGQGWLDQGFVPNDLNDPVKVDLALAGELDTEADEFFFNFMGQSGKFIIDSDGTIRFAPQQNIKITFTSLLQSFLVQTPDGAEFVFAATESGSSAQFCDQVESEAKSPEISAWYLTEYRNPAITDETIQFSYKEREITYITGYSSTAHGRTLINEGGIEPRCEINCSKPSDDQCVSIATNSALFLESITTEVSSAIFEDMTRQDLSGGLAYTGINIYGSSNGLLRSITFDQSYFICPGRSLDETLKYSFDSPRHKRLRLNRVFVTGASNEELIYSLQYFDDKNLPPRISFAQDYWGYYNGRHSNLNLSPFIDEPLDQNFSIKLADRRVDSSFLEVGLLREITYPSGATIEFDYEAHDFGNFIREDLTQFDTITEFLFDTLDDPPIQNYSHCFPQNSPKYDLEIQYRWKLNEPDEIILDIETDDNLLNVFIHPDSTEGSNTIKLPYVGNDSCIDFTFRSYSDTNFLVINFIRYRQKTVLNKDTIDALAGGVRIKKIITNDNAGNTLEKSFRYQQPDGSTSGLTNMFPSFNGIIGSKTRCIPSCKSTPLGLECGFVRCFWISRSSSSNTPLGAYNGSHVVYSRVEEILNGGALGKSVYEYNVRLSQPGATTFSQKISFEGYDLGYILPTVLSGKPFSNDNWNSGLLMHETHFKGGDGGEGSANGGQEFIPVFEKEYTYNLNAQSLSGNSTTVSFGLPFLPNFAGSTTGTLPRIEYAFYSNWYTLDKVVERFYDDDGQNAVVKESRSYYDPVNLMMESSDFANSDGNAYETEYTYEQIGDFDQTPGQYVILNKESTTSKDGAIFQGIKTTYTTGPNELKLPHIVENIEGGYGWDLYGTYGDYSEDGFPMSFQRDGYEMYGPVSYVWEEGLLKSQNYADFDWSFEYYPNSRQLKRLTQVDGQIIDYQYDGLQRLEHIKERGGARETFHKYVIGGPNYIETKTTYADAPSRTIQKHFNGFGTYMHTLSLNYDPGGGHVITDGGYLDPLQRHDQVVFLPGTFKKLKLEGSPHGRLLKETFPDGANITYEYPYSSFFVNRVIDENENPTTTETDLVEKNHKVTNAIGGQTKYRYNAYDNIDTILTPEGQLYLYGYDSHQRLQSKSIPGGGTSNYVNNDQDLVESMTNANGLVTTYVYDAHDRPLTTTVDGKTITQTYDKDRLSTVTEQTFNGASIGEVYNYDAFGRVASQNNSTIKGADTYSFNYQHTDLVTTTLRAAPSVGTEETFRYDRWGRLNTHDLAVGGQKARIQENAYNGRDELIFKRLYGSEGNVLHANKYKYHIRGWLTDINKVTSGKELEALASCDSIPLSEPIDKLFDYEEDTTEQVVLQEVLNRRFYETIRVGDYQPCSEEVCDTLPCTSQEQIQQLMDYTEIIQHMDTTLLKDEYIVCEGTSLTNVSKGDGTALILPTKLFRVRFCDGTEVYLPEVYLQDLSGPHEIVQEVAITDPNQLFLVIVEGDPVQVNLTELFKLVAEGIDIGVDGYEQCFMESCDSIVPPVCDATVTFAQTEYLDTLADSLLLVEDLSYPITLHRVVLCSGVEIYLLDSELTNLPGDYTLIDSEVVTDPNDKLDVTPDTSSVIGPLFSMRLNYDKGTTTLKGPAQRNGNISHVYWQVKGRTPKGYGYTYDPINRMTLATYGEVFGEGDVQQISLSDRYSVYGIDYTADGNFNTLSRNGPVNSCENGATFGVIDMLTYTISGNQLNSITDAGARDGFDIGAGGSFGYDGAGNVNNLGPKGANFTYNALNLPAQANYTSGSAQVTWDYSAGGQKVTYQGLQDTKEYIPGIEYVNDKPYVYHPEGRVYVDSTGEWLFEYTLRDHLGNSRVIFADTSRDGSIDPATEVLREAHYYPFGMEQQGPWNVQVDSLHPHLYNGKEFHYDSLDVDGDGNNELALGWYDYGARFYDPSIARFTSVDRFAEKYSFQSPYAYAANNPIKYIDVNGDSVRISTGSGQYAYYDNGNVYDASGNQYTGPGVKVKKNGKIKLKGDLKRTVNALNSISGGGVAGSELVSSLVNSTSTVTITPGSKNQATGLNVTFDPSDSDGGLDVKGGTNRPAFIGLAHELVHAKEFRDKTINYGVWFQTPGGKKVLNAEISASNYENRIRAENSVPLRAYYSTTAYPPAALLNGSKAKYPSRGASLAPLSRRAIKPVTSN